MARSRKNKARGKRLRSRNNKKGGFGESHDYINLTELQEKSIIKLKSSGFTNYNKDFQLLKKEKDRIMNLNSDTVSIFGDILLKFAAFIHPNATCEIVSLPIQSNEADKTWNVVITIDYSEANRRFLHPNTESEVKENNVVSIHAWMGYYQKNIKKPCIFFNQLPDNEYARNSECRFKLYESFFEIKPPPRTN
jgi:hypothetical protein